mgnify:CR=1 FL=1
MFKVMFDILKTNVYHIATNARKAVSSECAGALLPFFSIEQIVRRTSLFYIPSFKDFDTLAPSL